MPSFDFQTAAQVIAGPGSLARLPQLTKAFGSAGLLVVGRDRKRSAALFSMLGDAGVSLTIFSVEGEPTLDAIREGVAVARARHVDFVIGFGGGSAIDAAKAIAALATNSGEPLDYLEIIGRGKDLVAPPLPCIAIPTTAGTGAEVTRNAVLSSPEHELKASLRGPFLLPRLALIDPELTVGLPPEITANTGLDALTQLLEAFVSHRANPFTDMFCRTGLTLVSRSLCNAYQSASGPSISDELPAREDMSLASLLSGMALANAGLGAVHGFASPLGGMTGAAHGAICASLLPAVVRTNIAALTRRQPESPSLAAYLQAATILAGSPEPKALHEWIIQLRSDLRVRPLGELDLERDRIPALVRRAAKASSMLGNPIELTDEELMQIVEDSW